MLEVLDQGRRAAGHAEGEGGVVALDVAVAVPVAAREAVVVSAPNLNEAHAPLEQAPGDEALAAEEFGFGLHVDGAGVVDAGSFRREAIHAPDVLRFTGNVEGVGRAELHGSGKFIGADTGREAVVAGPGLGMQAVEFGEGSETGLVIPGRDELACGREKVGDGRFVAGADNRALVLGG